MKEDYLWDKTGGDPEIEKLENALAAFRCRETEPPAIPAKIISFERKAPRRFFRFAFAFATCAAFVIASVGIWFRFSSDKAESDLAGTASPQRNFDSAKSIFEKNSNDVFDSNVANNETPKQIAGRKVVKARKAIPPPTNRKNKTTEKVIIAKNPILSLTEEEKYAYSQLMLALSITNSKLKLVEDKINGAEAEEPKAVHKKGQ